MGRFDTETAMHIGVVCIIGISFSAVKVNSARQDKKGEKPRKGALTDGSGSAIAGSKNFTLSRFTILM